MENYFNELKKFRLKLLGLENVVGVGVGYKQNSDVNQSRPAYIVYVEKKVETPEIADSHIVPRKMGGIETDVVEIGQVRLLGLRTMRTRPCRPGMSIGHYRSTAGTLGAVVMDKSTKELLVLSNNHVLANSSSLQDVRATVGDPILQPGPYDGGTEQDRIGELYRFVPLHKNIAESDCPVAVAVAGGCTKMIRLIKPEYEMRFYKRFGGENVVDCAVARLDSPDLADGTILEIGSVSGMAEAVPGDKVQKSGRTTGLSRGVIRSVGTTIQVEMGEDEKIWFTDQVVSDLPSQPGDSGALVVNEEQQAVGLLFAGSDKVTVFNRICHVVKRLDIEFL
jgi:S1-C subfamily serine protease